jgi:hypothetical protein
MQTQMKSTLLDLVQTLSSFIDDDREVVSTIVFLVNSGSVRLCGNFAGATIEILSPYPSTAQQRSLFS